MRTAIAKTALLLCILSWFSCTIIQTESEDDEDKLPCEIETPGWVISGSRMDFTPATAAEYIKDPEHIRLLNLYGFSKLSVLEYKAISSPEKEITIEIYRMDSSLNSFGILGMMRPENAEDSIYSNYSYSAPNSVSFRKGSYYIKILHPLKGISINDLKIFSNVICEKITDNHPLPGYLSLAGNIDGVVIYRIDGPVGLPGIKKIFINKTNLFEKPVTIFFVRRDSAHISAGEFSNLLKDKNFILSGAGDSQTVFNKINDDEYIFVSVFKEWIFGVLNAGDIPYGEKMQSYLLNKIKEYTIADKK